jgi:hypothetical protein
MLKKPLFKITKSFINVKKVRNKSLLLVAVLFCSIIIFGFNYIHTLAGYTLGEKGSAVTNGTVSGGNCPTFPVTHPVFVVQLYSLSSGMSTEKGAYDKQADAVHTVIPYASNDALWLCSNDLSAYLKRHNFDTPEQVYITRKASETDKSMILAGGKNDPTTRGRIKYLSNYETTTPSNDFSKGIFYNTILQYYVADNRSLKKLFYDSKFLGLLESPSSSQVKNSMELWSYITDVNATGSDKEGWQYTINIKPKVDAFLQIDSTSDSKELLAKGLKINDWDATHSIQISTNEKTISVGEAFNLRYLDLLMTLSAISNNKSYWKTGMQSYMIDNNGAANISITSGIVARMDSLSTQGGDVEPATVFVSCNDDTQVAYRVGTDYNLSKLTSSITVAEKAKSGDYLDRLKVAVSLSKSSKYYHAGIYDSAIISRIITERVKKVVNKKLVFENSNNPTNMSGFLYFKYDKGKWDSVNWVLEPPISAAVNYKAVLMVDSKNSNILNSKKGPVYGVKKTVRLFDLKDLFSKELTSYQETVKTKDSVKVNLTLQALSVKGNSAGSLASINEWDSFIKLNNIKNFRVKIILQRNHNGTAFTPQGDRLFPQIHSGTNEWCTSTKWITVTASDLLTLLSGKKPIGIWLDDSIAGIDVKNDKEVDVTWCSRIYLQYQIGKEWFYLTGKESTTSDKLNISSVDTTIPEIRQSNKASIGYIWKISPRKNDVTYPFAIWTSEEPALDYAELKEGSIYNETFEAMAGVPTTRTLYFSSGGNEFMADFQVDYEANSSAVRKYTSHFNGTECEYKTGDQAKTYTVPSPSGANSSDVTVDVHGGDVTVTATWEGSIPNKATAKTVTALHNAAATCTAIPDRSAYNAAKTQANSWASTLQGYSISYTAASDGKTRTTQFSNAHISSDNPADPQTTTASDSKTCTYVAPSYDSKGKMTDPGKPCSNEMATATANPGPAGSYTITVTATIPVHVICGPCCLHELPAISDTWSQYLTYDTIKLTKCNVYKIQNGYVTGMDEITYNSEENIIASITQGDPNIFYNIAALNSPAYTNNVLTNGSRIGRIRYTLQEAQGDNVYYEEMASGISNRTNKCDGMAGTVCPSNPIPGGGRGHTEPWATGCLYTNTAFENKERKNEATTGTKSGYNSETDAKDLQTAEWKRFWQRRNQTVTATVISDMLILQTSSGDQSPVYYAENSTAKAQVNFPTLRAAANGNTGIKSTSAEDTALPETQAAVDSKWKKMWTNNAASFADVIAAGINVGSYNGYYNLTSTKYKGTGNGPAITTRFDNDLTVFTAPSDELGVATVGSSQSFTKPAYKSSNIASPGKSQARMDRVTDLRIYQDKIKQKPTNKNGEYATGDSYVFYVPILKYKVVPDIVVDTGSNTNESQGMEDNEQNADDGTGNGEEVPGTFKEEESTVLTGAGYKYGPGLIYKSRYSAYDDNLDYKVNNIITLDAVSVQDAMIVASDVKDQRTEDGIVKDAMDTLSALEKCPGTPELCEYRVLNCKYTLDTNSISFDYEDKASSMLFGYTGNVQSATLEPGIYKLEAFGAAGGNGRLTNTTTMVPESGGRGGYTSGMVTLSDKTTLYLCVGGKGANQSSLNYQAYGVGGYNGGGNGGADMVDASSPESGAGGGGGTSIATASGTLASLSADKATVLLAAGGGGGAMSYLTSGSTEGYGGSGGGTSGTSLNSGASVPGTQTGGYGFGQGQSGINSYNASNSGNYATGGNGGGYYGGKVAAVPDSAAVPGSATINTGGAGGSGYIAATLTGGLMQTGVNRGDGYVKITKLEDLTEDAYSSLAGDSITNSILNSDGAHNIYNLPSAMALSFEDGSFSGFGTGQYLKVTGQGTSLELPYNDCQVNLNAASRIKVSSDIYIPSAPAEDTMLFSIGGVGLYIPADSTAPVFITSVGQTRASTVNLVGKKVKIAVTFSMGSLYDCELSIDGVNILPQVTTGLTDAQIAAAAIQEDMRGSGLNIGCWEKDSNYATGFYLDNTVVTRCGGTLQHTASCYTTYKQNDYFFQNDYNGLTTGRNTIDWAAAYDDGTYGITSIYSRHEHSPSCLTTNSRGYQIALAEAKDGDWASLKKELGTTLFNLVVSNFDIDTNSGAAPSVTYNFAYTGNYQTFTAPRKGVYNFETWGPSASGSYAGLGGYSKGTYLLNAGQIIYIYVGGQYGFNGGGTSTGNGGGNVTTYGGGATDIRVGGMALSNRVIVAGGGGGGTYNGYWYYGTGGNNASASYSIGQGQDYSHSCSNYVGAGGGGYYGGAASSDGGAAGGQGGSGYVGGVTQGSMTSGVGNGNGYATITSIKTFPEDNELFTYIKANMNLIPDTVTTGGASIINPIWDCKCIYNTGTSYTEQTSLTCNEPHHFGGHYDYANTICWDACHKDANHKTTKKDPIDPNGNKIKQAAYVTLDNFFKVYFPNTGDFFGNGAYGLLQPSINRGKGYTQGMDTTEWTREKYVKFDFDVLYERNGVWENHPAGDWISLEVINPLTTKTYWLSSENTLTLNGDTYVFDTANKLLNYKGGSTTLMEGGTMAVMNGKIFVLNTDGSISVSSPYTEYNFYTLLENNEESCIEAQFAAEAINYDDQSTIEAPYEGNGDYEDEYSIYAYGNAYVTNKERFGDFTSHHTAGKLSYLDVIGGIGNMIIEDTDDMRFSNYFKKSKVTNNDDWLIQGIISEVDSSISEHYLSWHRNTLGYPLAVDVRGEQVSEANGYYNTWGTQGWTTKADSGSLGLSSDKNTNKVLQAEQQKLGYNVLFDITTMGDYNQYLQVIPYFYALNKKTSELTPVDVYIRDNEEYKPINYFGLYSEYMGSDGNYKEGYDTLSDKLYKYTMYLNWTNESARRNYGAGSKEAKITDAVKDYFMEDILDGNGEPTGFKYLTVPFGNYYNEGSMQCLQPGLRGRTFVGSSQVTAIKEQARRLGITADGINGGIETNLDGSYLPQVFNRQAQRWHLTMGLPSSATFTAYREKGIHVTPEEEWYIVTYTQDGVTKTKQFSKPYLAANVGDKDYGVGNTFTILGVQYTITGKYNAGGEFNNNGDYVILMTADIKAIGDVWNLKYETGEDNGNIKIDGNMYQFGSSIPTFIAAYDTVSSLVDVSTQHTH